MPDTRQQPANASSMAASFCPVSFSLKSSAENRITKHGAVYSNIAAADRLM